MNFHKKLKNLLLGAIIGDALGTPFDGFSKGHIQAHFKMIDTYCDPTPALKNKIFKWCKPGLISSISQSMFLLALFNPGKKNSNISDFIQYFLKAGTAGEAEFGIFRHPGPSERSLLAAIPDRNYSATSTIPSARPVPIIVPALLTISNKKKLTIPDIISYAQLFTANNHTISGIIIMYKILLSTLNDSSDDIITHSIEIINELTHEILEDSPQIFKLKINPDTLSQAVSIYSDIFKTSNNQYNNTKYNESICNVVNRYLKSPIKRATVDNPLCIIPYSLFLTRNLASNPSSALFTALREGGSTAVLCSLVGSITGALHHQDWLPNRLITDLVNRKSIMKTVETIVKGSTTKQMIESFIASEAPITNKEHEELQARMKHWKPKTRQTISHKKKKDELSRHVVESWTKLDKARWKKEKKKMQKDNDE